MKNKNVLAAVLMSVGILLILVGPASSLVYTATKQPKTAKGTHKMYSIFSILFSAHCGNAYSKSCGMLLTDCEVVGQDQKFKIDSIDCATNVLEETVQDGK